MVIVMGSLFSFLIFRSFFLLSCILPPSSFVHICLWIKKNPSCFLLSFLFNDKFQSISIPVRLGFDAFLLAVAFFPWCTPVSIVDCHVCGTRCHSALFFLWGAFSGVMMLYLQSFFEHVAWLPWVISSCTYLQVLWPDLDYLTWKALFYYDKKSPIKAEKQRKHCHILLQSIHTNKQANCPKQ